MVTSVASLTMAALLILGALQNSVVDKQALGRKYHYSHVGTTESEKCNCGSSTTTESCRPTSIGKEILVAMYIGMTEYGMHIQLW